MNRRQFLVGTGVGLGLAGAATGAYGAFIETENLDVTHAARASLLGAKLRVVQLTDLHLHHITGVHEKVARAIAAAQPDVLIISGDTIDRNHKLPLLPELLQMFPQVPHKFATLGNWEHQASVSNVQLAKVYAKGDVDLLINRRVDLGGVSFIGLDDSTAGTPDMRLAHRTENPTVIIAHSPGFRDELGQRLSKRPDLLPDLMLSGHTHGGQITFFGWAPVTPRGSGPYLYGWYGSVKPRLFVSRGIGTTSIPIRLGATPEVVIFEL